MSSYPAPTYYFSNIGFNTNFYVVSTSSGGVSLSALKNYFLSKKENDTCNSQITFNSANTNFANIVNLSSSTGQGEVHFNDSTNTNTLSSIYSTSTTLTIDTKTLTNGLIVKNNTGTNLLQANASGLSLVSPLNMAYATAQDFSSSSTVGYNINCITSSNATLSTATTSTIYNSNNQVALPIGVYLFSALYTFVANGFSGTISSSTTSFGYSSGTSATPSTNTKTTLYTYMANSIHTSSTLNFPYNFSQIVSITTANSYLVPFLIVTLTGTISGTLQLRIDGYNLTRIA